MTLLLSNILFSEHKLMECNVSILVSQEDKIDEKNHWNKINIVRQVGGSAEDVIIGTNVFCEKTFLGNI